MQWLGLNHTGSLWITWPLTLYDIEIKYLAGISLRDPRYTAPEETLSFPAAAAGAEGGGTTAGRP